MPAKRARPGSTDADEEDFPRGGASVLTPLEERKLKLKAKADLEHELRVSGTGTPRARTKKARLGKAALQSDVEGDLFKSHVAAGRLPKFVEPLRMSVRYLGSRGSVLARSLCTSMKLADVARGLEQRQLRVTRESRRKNIGEGAKVWGVIVEVTSRFLVVSLPHGLRGHVAPSDASDVLRAFAKPQPTAADRRLRNAAGGPPPDMADLFYPGQFVRAKVLSVDTKQADVEGATKAAKRLRKICLSLCLEDVCEGLERSAIGKGMALPAVVRAVEGHGAALGVGGRGVTAFLPHDAYRAAFGDESEPLLGMLLQVVVTECLREGKELLVDCSPAAVARALTPELGGGFALSGLLPGQLVTVTVRNVLSDGLLVSFLRFFHGTVDQFHIPHEQVSTWRAHVNVNQRLNARILYVDEASKQVRLSLLKHLVAYQLPTTLPTLGEVVDASVVRADTALGLLLSIPSDPLPSLGFVHISNVSSDGKVAATLAKQYPKGTSVTAKVIGFRPMDGLATLTMRRDAIDAAHGVTWDTLQPGMLVDGQVHAVEEFGVLVQLARNVRGLVPPLHVSDVASSKKAMSRYKVGASVQARVLSVDARSRRVTLTCKRALLGSKLMPISSVETATAGARSHGWVTGVTEHGLFVEFYGRVKGLVPTAEAAVPPGAVLSDVFSVGQVLKCTVIGTDPKKGLRLSLRKRGALPAAAAAEDVLRGLHVGDVVRDVTVSRLVPSDGGDGSAAAAVVTLRGPAGGTLTARLARSHFSDHPHAADTLASALAVGTTLPRVLLLDYDETTHAVTVTRKAAMIEAAEAGALPAAFTDLREGQQVPGFVASVTQDAVFVRFAGRLTGRAGLPQVADAFVTDASMHFKAGQSVRAVVLNVDAPAGRFSVSLKPSATCRTDAALLHTYFQDMDLAAVATNVSLEGPEIGATVSVTATEQHDYGLVCDMPRYDAVGLITPSQMPAKSPPVGHTFAARVLDVNHVDAIVDLSGRMGEEGAAHGAEAGLDALRVGAVTEAVVELVKQDSMYLVVTVPRLSHAVAFVPTCDYNVQQQNATRHFTLGQRVTAAVARLPQGPAGRLLLHTTLSRAMPVAQPQRRAPVAPGQVTPVKVKAVHGMHADVLVGKRFGRLHVTEIDDLRLDCFPKIGSRPLEGVKAGQELEAVVLGLPAAGGAKEHRYLEVSTRPSAIAAARSGAAALAAVSWSSLRRGDVVCGIVQEVDSGHLYVSLSPRVRGRVHVLQASADPRELARPSSVFRIGAVVRTTVVSVDAEHGRLDLSLLEHPRFAMLAKGAPLDETGALVMARVNGTSEHGVDVQLVTGAPATVPMTALHDAFVPNATEGIKAGTFMRTRIVSVTGARVMLAAKQAMGGQHAGHSQPVDGPETPVPGAQLTWHKGDIVHGYVKAAHSRGAKGAGLYVWLSDAVQARVQLNRLADHYVDDPVTAFPRGKHITARVLEADGARVELTMRSNQLAGSQWRTLSSLEVGQVVFGRVKRVEKFGVFVDIADSSLSGLAHVSELSDAFCRDPSANFALGDRVRAVVLRKDEGKGQLSLGLKPSYFSGAALAAAGDDGDGDESEEGMRAVAGAGEEMERGAPVDLEAAMTAAFDEESEDASSDDASSDDAVGHEASDDAGSDSAGDDHLDMASRGDVYDTDRDGAAADAAAASAATAGRAQASQRRALPHPRSEATRNEAHQTRGVTSASTSGDETEGSSEVGGAGDSARGGASAMEKVDAGFGWQALVLGEGRAQRAEDTHSDAQPSSKGPSKSARKRAAADREARIRKAELSRVNALAPESRDDFERLILGSPNSSYLWIRYMAFLLQMADVAEARKVAERALETIDYRDEKEKFNVWLAYLNLENAYADDPEAAAATLLKRALQYNDAKRMYLAAMDIFERSQRAELLRSCAQGVRRKFGTSCKVWVRLYMLELSSGRDPSALLPRALQTLPKRKHVKFLSRVGINEFKGGSAERARAVFENILQTHPKRTDLWGVYVDQEIKYGDQVSTRNLLDRAIHLDLPAKKMRFLFKRYVAYEAEHGDPERVAYVKQRALEFIESHQ